MSPCNPAVLRLSPRNSCMMANDVRGQRTMRTRRYNRKIRATSWVAMLSIAGMALLTPYAQAQQIHERIEAAKPKPVSELAPGLTQSLTPEQWAKVDAKLAAAAHPHADARPLSEKEMGRERGRGEGRSKYFAGTLPWHRSLRDVNLCNGNLFKSFTDIQVAPAKGAGLALQRTYNSNDDRVGPFGIGWTHAYDIRVGEEAQDSGDAAGAANDGDAGYGDQNFAARVDFFGHPHRYHRDADGLYSPPPYLYDQLDSRYSQALVEGAIAVDDDTQVSMDGTTKHFRRIGNARVCDSITDRYTNATTLTYENENAAATEEARLQSVTDPSGRTLTFTWQDFGTGTNHVYRVVRVSGPQYDVAYEYYTDTNDTASLYNLKSVTLDPNPQGGSGHLNRKTSFAYQAAIGDERGLLNSITDPLGHSVTYTYSTATHAPQTVWVTQVNEAASDVNHAAQTLTWNIIPKPDLEYDGILGIMLAAKSNTGLSFELRVDSYYRAYYLNISGAPHYLHTVSYEPGTNNVSTVTQDDFGLSTIFVYGPHGNELLHRSHNASTAGDTATGIHGAVDDVVTTAYYSGSQYFQKQSVTDANGRTTTFGVGTKSDANIGNRGSVLWVRDAGYGVSSNPSHGQQFTYTYYSTGQKASETNLNGTRTTYEYGGTGDGMNAQGAVGNLTQVVQDAPPAVPQQGRTYQQRTTTMSYDVAGHVLSSVDPMNLTSTFTYNVLGQPLTAQFPHKTDGTRTKPRLPKASPTITTSRVFR